MELNFTIVVAILVLALSGLVLLVAFGLVARIQSSEKESGRGWNLFTRSGENYPLPHGDCYDACMKESQWDRSKSPECVSACGL